MLNGMYVSGDGTRYWYVNSQLHRNDGPAIERVSGARRWYRNGQLHREDGPAIEHANGVGWWYWHGRYCSFREWLAANNKLTPQQKMLLMLKYGDG